MRNDHLDQRCRHLVDCADHRRRSVAVQHLQSVHLLSQSLAAVEGCSEWFCGGVVTYRTDAKRTVLGVTAPSVVEEDAARQFGQVAELGQAPWLDSISRDWLDSGELDTMRDRLALRGVTSNPSIFQAALSKGNAYDAQVAELAERAGVEVTPRLREEVCAPHGLDFHVGLGPGELARAVELTGYDEEFRRRGSEYGPVFHRALGNPPGALDPAVVNSTPWRRAEIAAVNGHGTARSVAGLYLALTQHGLLSEPLLQEAVRPHAQGVDQVLGQEASWGLGFGVDPDGFGMGGVGGSFGWWSEAGGYAFAFLTGHIGDHGRGDRLENALREVLGLPSV